MEPSTVNALNVGAVGEPGGFSPGFAAKAAVLSEKAAIAATRVETKSFLKAFLIFVVLYFNFCLIGKNPTYTISQKGGWRNTRNRDFYH
jgi:hypothetical protein